VKNDVSKRINVTLPDTLYDELERWAEAQGRPTANLAAFLIEIGLKEGKEKGEVPPPVKPQNSKRI
jgi:CopG-like RHH_1 or ribbon-helix-helix domain, RHH_5